MVTKGKWWLTTAGVFVFNANTALAVPIRSAANLVGSYFDEIDSGIEDGDAVAEVVRGKRIKAAMHRVISQARTQGFLTAAKHSKAKMPALYGRKVLNAADKRSGQVNKWMKRTTRRVLKNTPDSEYVLSKQRAIASARYEAARSYFRGVRDGFQGSSWEKSWITSSDDPCPNCEDNEDAGFIDVDDVFPSGDDYPALHLGCGCSIGVRKGQS